MAKETGLGSANMSQEDKDRIHAMGGKASHSQSARSKTPDDNDVISNHEGSGAMSKADQRKGGKNSHKR